MVKFWLTKIYDQRYTAVQRYWSTAGISDDTPRSSMAELGYWGWTLLGVSIAGIFVATLSFLARLYVRRFLTRNLDVSDLFMGLGLFAVYGFTACVIAGKSPSAAWLSTVAYTSRDKLPLVVSDTMFLTCRAPFVVERLW